MKALFSFDQIIKALANTFMPLVCVIVITLFTASCSTVPTKQTTSTDSTANSLTAKVKSDNETTDDITQRLECRDVDVTGSRFKKKICEYKETWAAIDKENEEKSGKLVRKLDQESGIINKGGQGASAGGTYNDAMTPPGGY